MKLQLLPFFIITSLSLPLNAETLDGLANVLKSDGVQSLIELINDHRVTEKNGRSYVVLEEKMMEMGTDKELPPMSKWRVSELKDGIGLRLHLNISHHYFEVSPVDALDLDSCPGGGATSGGAFKTYSNGTSIDFSWSCGSAGCSYQARFSDGIAPCK